MRSSSRSVAQRDELLDELEDEQAQARRDQRPVMRAITRFEGRVLERRQAISIVTARLTTARLDDLAERSDVQAVIASPRQRPELDTSIATVGAPEFWALASDGGSGPEHVRSDVDVSMGDDEPDPDHPAFDRIAVDIGDDDPSHHGTHTGGVVASQDATYTGVAPGISELFGGDYDRYFASDPAEVISNSFGIDTTNDNLGNLSDGLVNALNVPEASSAGNRNGQINPGPEPDFAPGQPTVGGESIGRNMISVGATGDNATSANHTDDQVAFYSSFGPTPGGRKKPDLTAPGTQITSPHFPWQDAAPDFDAIDGTSLSTPHVGGAAALLMAAGMSDMRAVKATLINSARSWCNGHIDDPLYGPELPAAPNCQLGWQPDVGWGHLDLQSAVEQRGFTQSGTVAEGSARFYRAGTSESGDRTTLVWNLRAEIGGPFPHDDVYFTVSNLDLRAYGADDLVEIPPPEALEGTGYCYTDAGPCTGPDAVEGTPPYDTVEQVRPPVGEDVIYKVESASEIEGSPSEPFALASAKALEALSNPSVEPTNVSRSPGEVNCSETVQVGAQLQNLSDDLAAEGSQVTLQLPVGVELVSGAQTQSVSNGTLDTSETSGSHGWTVRATQSGTHQLTVRGSGGTMGETFSSSENVSFTADCSAPEVRPANASVQPDRVQCGGTQTVRSAFANGAFTDAQDARAQIALSGGFDLVAGAASQVVSGGVLERRTASEQHAWTIRAGQPRSGAATLIGSTVAGGGRRESARDVELAACFELATQIAGERVRRAKRRATARGRVESAAQGSQPLVGEVRIRFFRPGEDVIRTREIDTDGRFRARARARTKGRYRVVVRYLGATGYQPVREEIATFKVGRKAGDRGRPG